MSMLTHSRKARLGLAGLGLVGGLVVAGCAEQSANSVSQDPIKNPMVFGLQGNANYAMQSSSYVAFTIAGSPGKPGKPGDKRYIAFCGEVASPNGGFQLAVGKQPTNFDKKSTASKVIARFTKVNKIVCGMAPFPEKSRDLAVGLFDEGRLVASSSVNPDAGPWAFSKNQSDSTGALPSTGEACGGKESPPRSFGPCLRGQVSARRKAVNDALYPPIPPDRVPFLPQWGVKR